MKITIDLSVRHMPIVEQVVLVTTLQVLKDYGWHVTSVNDAENIEPVDSIAEAIETLAGVDEAVTIEVTSRDSDSWLLYIPGNGIDCISDHGIKLTQFVSEADNIVRGEW